MKKPSFVLSKECEKYAKKFTRSVVNAKTPQEVVDLFSQNSYLKSDLGGSAKIFYKALDIGPKIDQGLFYHLNTIRLRNDIYTLAFTDYAKKHNLLKEEEADKFAKSLVDCMVF